MPRTDWPLHMQAMHAVRYPHMWSVTELTALVIKLREEEI